MLEIEHAAAAERLRKAEAAAWRLYDEAERREQNRHMATLRELGERCKGRLQKARLAFERETNPNA